MEAAGRDRGEGEQVAQLACGRLRRPHRQCRLVRVPCSLLHMCMLSTHLCRRWCGAGIEKCLKLALHSLRGKGRERSSECGVQKQSRACTLGPGEEDPLSCSTQACCCKPPAGYTPAASDLQHKECAGVLPLLHLPAVHHDCVCAAGLEETGNQFVTCVTLWPPATQCAGPPPSCMP